MQARNELERYAYSVSGLPSSLRFGVRGSGFGVGLGIPKNRWLLTPSGGLAERIGKAGL